MDQGTYAWHAARLGVPTASQFKRLFTPKGEPRKGDMPQSYLCELAAERLTGALTDHGMTDAMQRGKDLEQQARKEYAFETGRKVRQIGLATLAGEGWLCGGSPDGLCADRGLEIKSPAYRNLIAAKRDGGAEYIIQCQACAWICNMPLWDLVLYSDTEGIASRTITLQADQKLHARFEEIIPQFCADLAAVVAEQIADGAVMQPIAGSDEAAEKIMDKMAPLESGQGR